MTPMNAKPSCRTPSLLLAALSLAAALPASATGEDGRAIMERADRENRPRYEVAHIEMDLVDSDGSVTERSLIWRFRNRDGERTSLMKFESPANVRGVGLLVKEQTGQPNAIWHYLPATRNVRRIAAGHKQNRFMGTELVFEDFEGLKLDKYRFERLRAAPCEGGRTCDLVEARASDPQERADSGYGKKVFWVGQKDAVIVRIELYDRDGTLVKTFTSQDLHRMGRYWRPRLQVMRNLVDKRETRLIERERVLDEPFDDYYLSQQYLRSE